jgi:hypothetical protein
LRARSTHDGMRHDLGVLNALGVLWVCVLDSDERKQGAPGRRNRIIFLQMCGSTRRPGIVTTILLFATLMPVDSLFKAIPRSRERNLISEGNIGRLDGKANSWRFGGNVICNAVHASNFIRDSIRYAAENVRREHEPDTHRCINNNELSSNNETNQSAVMKSSDWTARRAITW